MMHISGANIFIEGGLEQFKKQKPDSLNKRQFVEDKISSEKVILMKYI